jgi:hypothetical protein
MKLFDYEKIFLLSHGRPKQLLEFFHEFNTGPNFIVNPKALVDGFWLTDKQKAEYLGICSLRSYEDYKTKGTTNLDIDIIPQWVPLEVIRSNPLINVTENKIIFLKEK